MSNHNVKYNLGTQLKVNTNTNTNTNDNNCYLY
jgi:hypothetical protein